MCKSCQCTMKNTKKLGLCFAIIFLVAALPIPINPAHASNSIYGFITCSTSGSCADRKTSSPNGFICPAQDRNLSTREICQVPSHCLASINNSASTPSTNIINFTDYKRGYSLGQLLAKNCHDRTVINGSRLFISGFLDGYDTMNITKCQDIGFR